MLKQICEISGKSNAHYALSPAVCKKKKKKQFMAKLRNCKEQAHTLSPLHNQRVPSVNYSHLDMKEPLRLGSQGCFWRRNWTLFPR